MKIKMHSQRNRAMEYCKKHSPEYYNRFMRKEHEDLLKNHVVETEEEREKRIEKRQKRIKEREKRIKEERRKRYWGMKSRFKPKTRPRSKK